MSEDRREKHTNRAISCFGIGAILLTIGLGMIFGVAGVLTAIGGSLLLFGAIALLMITR